MAADDRTKRKSEDEAGAFDDDDDDDDDSFDSDFSGSSDDEEELEALQQLSAQIQEAKATNEKLKQTLLSHRHKKQKASATNNGASTEDHSQRDLVAALFQQRAVDQAKKEGDTIV